MRLAVDQPTFFIETYGCQMNSADSEVVAAILAAAGYRPSATLEQADLVLLNTCSVRDNAEQRVWGRLDHMRGLRRRRPGTLVGVIGCMAERLSGRLLEHDSVDLAAGPDRYRDLPLLADAAREGRRRALSGLPDAAEGDQAAAETYSGITPERMDPDAVGGFVTITRGCDNFCTYCIVPYTRGRERSRDPRDIEAEVRDLAGRGYREVTLLGQNVNSYRWDDGQGGAPLRFDGLIARVAQAAPGVRVRFTTSHPKDLSDDLLRAMAAHANICPHIHLPAQSGSDATLERMNRRYTRGYYLGRVARIREIVPGCAITTDLFCGFSGETDDDFEQTLSLMREVEFDAAFMFKYSQREGTYAARRLPDDVPEQEKVRRLERMIALQNEISARRNQALVGTVVEALVEGPSKKSDADAYGRTPHGKAVVFGNPGGAARRGDTVRVRVTAATSATLLGEIDANN